MSDKQKERGRPDMEINLDRSKRVLSTSVFWIIFLAVGALLAFLLMRFTGSKVIALSCAGGMLLYMLIASAITSKNLSQAPGDGRLD